MRQIISDGRWPVNSLSTIRKAREILQGRGLGTTPCTLAAPSHIMESLRLSITNTATSYKQFLKGNCLIHDFVELGEKRFRGNSNAVVYAVRVDFDCFPVPEFDFYAVEIIDIVV